MKKKHIIYGIISLLGIVLLAAIVFLSSLLPIITGYAAKNLCSGVFVAGRDVAEIEAIDLSFMPIRYTKNVVNYEEKSVKSRFLWGSSEAIYREGFGVTLVKGTTIDELLAEKFPLKTTIDFQPDTVLWPMGEMVVDSIPENVDVKGISSLVETLFDKNGYGGTPFAFMAVHKGLPIAEAYRKGLDKDTRFLSWSMAKSVTNALVGIMVKEGRMDVYEPVNIEEWDDERSAITLNDLMQMQSGLEWNEDYGSRSDVNVMLHCKGNMAEYVIGKGLEYEPGTHWYYSSGSTNIVSYLIHKEFNSDSLYLDLAYNQLFKKIGINDAVFETDVEGTMVGSSYLYATARDFARFGMLYLNDGIFNNQRILPEGWVEYTSTSASNSDNNYGAFFWLNKGNSIKTVPTDMIYCSGHDGQQIYIIPSKDLVVVLLGYSPRSKGSLRFDQLMNDLLECI